jgi:ubiquinone/menaquinone biosynthesis C-methylase UbiE
LQKRKLDNITIVEGVADDTNLPSNCCDSIYLRHAYHHLTRPQDFDKNLVRSLKPGAHLAIIDFPPTSDLPPVEGVPKNRGGHGIPEKVMVDELTSAGLVIEKVIDEWSGHDYCVSLVHHAHAAATQLFNDAVVGNGTAEYWCGISHWRRMLGCAYRQVNQG